MIASYARQDQLLTAADAPEEDLQVLIAEKDEFMDKVDGVKMMALLAGERKPPATEPRPAGPTNDGLRSDAPTGQRSQSRRRSRSRSPEPVTRLPLHELPKFDGTYANWPIFWNQFKITIDARRIPEIHNFTYLKSCVKGEAFNLIKSLLMEERSYDTALTLLRARYEDTTLVLCDHMGTLFDAPAASNNNPASLRRLVSIFQDTITAIENEGIRSGFVFAHFLLLKKLDVETRRAWEEAYQQMTMLDGFRKSCKTESVALDGEGEQEVEDGSSESYEMRFKQLMAFLFDRLQRSERAEFARTSTQQNKKSSNAAAKFSAPAGPAAKKGSGGGGFQPKSSGGGNQGNKNPTACPQCNKKDHLYLSKCPDFQKLSIPQRYATATKLRVCFNCLSTSHRARDCTSTFACRVCGQQKHHHTLLHSDDKNGPGAAPVAKENKKPGGFMVISDQAEIAESGDIPSVTAADVPDTPDGAGTSKASDKPDGERQAKIDDDSRHTDNSAPAVEAAPATAVDGVSQAGSTTLSVSTVLRGSTVFLCTAMVPVITAFGYTITLRTLFDTGSQVDLISERAAQEIGHDLRGEAITLQGVGGDTVQTSKGRITFTVDPPGGQRSKVTCHVMPQVVGKLPRTSLPRDFMRQFDGYELADPTFLRENQIDVLLGMGYFHHFVLPDVVLVLIPTAHQRQPIHKTTEQPRYNLRARNTNNEA